jgi:hypothetical protein
VMRRLPFADVVPISALIRALRSYIGKQLFGRNRSGQVNARQRTGEQPPSCAFWARRSLRLPHAI